MIWQMVTTVEISTVSMHEPKIADLSDFLFVVDKLYLRNTKSDQA